MPRIKLKATDNKPTKDEFTELLKRKLPNYDIRPIDFLSKIMKLSKDPKSSESFGISILTPEKIAVVVGFDASKNVISMQDVPETMLSGSLVFKQIFRHLTNPISEQDYRKIFTEIYLILKPKYVSDLLKF